MTDITGILPTVNQTWTPVNTNATYFMQLFNSTFGLGNLDNISYTSIGYWLLAPITTSFGSSDIIWMVFFGLPGLMLYWRTRKAIYPFILMIIIAPFAFWMLPYDVQEGMIILLVASIAGVMYEFWTSIKKH